MEHNVWPYKLVGTKQSLFSLGSEKRKVMELFDDEYVLFITISPNPKVRIKHTTLRSKKQPMIAYGISLQSDQLRYCITYFTSVYLSRCMDPKFVFTVEHNAQGNVHLHILLSDPSIKNKTALDILRREVMLDDRTLANLKGSKDYMNNIVECKDVKETMEYLAKDYDTNVKNGPYYNYYSEELISEHIVLQDGLHKKDKSKV